MRVIAGSAKGVRLKAPPGRDVRPTSGRVKESLFGMLGERVVGARVLDLFAGSGALGIESLSRGAASATFVDSHPASLRVIKENLERARLADKGTLVRGDALAVARQLARRGCRYDLVFADPPYERGLAATVIALCLEEPLLAEEGWLVIEHSPREEIPPVGENLAMIRSRRYGDTAVSIFCRCAPSEKPSRQS